MATVSRQDLVARAGHFSVRLVRFTGALEPRAPLPPRVLDQLASAGTAIGANLAEARAVITRREMARAYEIALKEAQETKYWLELVHALELGDPSERTWLRQRP